MSMKVRYTIYSYHWNETGAGARKRRDSGHQGGPGRHCRRAQPRPGDARCRGPLAARGLGFVRRALGSTAGVGAGVRLHGT
jgi:hypothetical protein